jgi:hypothetical protein
MESDRFAPFSISQETLDAFRGMRGAGSSLSQLQSRQIKLDDKETEGQKHDEGKPRWDLLPYGPLADVVAVLTHGAKKYADDNWQKVPGAKRRYFRAGMGHLIAWWSGEKHDTESGLPHLAHAVCCLLFLLWYDEL